MLTPEAWASPAAVARQLRACLETRTSRFGQKLGYASGCYEIRISLCKDGIVAGVDWNPHSSSAQFSWIPFEKLNCEDVLGVVRGGALTGSDGIADVFDLDPSLCSGLSGIVFARVRRMAIANAHNALIFRASEFLTGRYWRISPGALTHMDDVIDLIHSA